MTILETYKWRIFWSRRDKPTKRNKTGRIKYEWMAYKLCDLMKIARPDCHHEVRRTDEEMPAWLIKTD